MTCPRPRQETEPRSPKPWAVSAVAPLTSLHVNDPDGMKGFQHHHLRTEEGTACTFASEGSDEDEKLTAKPPSPPLPAATGPAMGWRASLAPFQSRYRQCLHPSPSSDFPGHADEGCGPNNRLPRPGVVACSWSTSRGVDGKEESARGRGVHLRRSGGD